MSLQFCCVPSCERYREVTGAAAWLARTSRLCVGCLNRLHANVARLPDLFDECGESLVGRRAAPAGRITGRRAAGLSLNGAVVNARSDMLSVAASWAGLIADERQLTVRPRRRVADLSVFLLDHLDWLAQHSEAVNALADFTRIVASAQAALDPQDARQVALGGCDVPDCAGTLQVVFGGRMSGVSCDRGHARGASEWLAVARRAGRRAVATQGSR